MPRCSSTTYSFWISSSTSWSRPSDTAPATPPPPPRSRRSALAVSARGRPPPHHHLTGEARVQLHVRAPLRGEILRYQHHGSNDLRPGVARDQDATMPDFQEHATAREPPRAGDGLKQRRIHRLDQRQHAYHSRIPARRDRQGQSPPPPGPREPATPRVHPPETSPRP